MSIFDFFRASNAFAPNAGISDMPSDGGIGGGGQPSWMQAISAGLKSLNPDQANGPVAAPPQRVANTPVPTRAAMPARTDANALDDIVNPPAQQSLYGPYADQYGYPRSPTGYPLMGPDSSLPHPELDKYSTMLDQYPERPTPSWMRTLATGALSYSNAQQPDQVEDTIGPTGRITRQIKHGVFKPMDINESNKVLNMPYEQQLGDYESELKNRAAGATLERQTNVDKSLSAQREATAARTINRIPLDVEDAQSRAERVRVAGFSAVTRAKLEAFNEATHNMTDAQKMQRAEEYGLDLQGVKDAAAYERVKAQQTGANARTAATQAGALTRERETTTGANTRAAGVQAGATERQGMKEDTGGIPSQQVRAQQLKANKVKQDHPEWAKFISTDANGMVTITPPGEHWWDYNSPTQDEYNTIVAAMRAPDVKPTRPKTPAGSTTPPNSPNAPNAPPAPNTPPNSPNAPTAQPNQQPQALDKVPPPEPGYVIVDDVNGHFVGYVKNDENLKRLNTSKYRVRQ